MWVYLPIVLIPSLLIVVISKQFFPRKITLKEWGLQFGVLIISTLLSVGVIKAGGLMGNWDFSIFNGQVTNKAKVKVSCEHQYVCGQTCSTVNGKQECQPVYCNEHDYDIDWKVYTTLGAWRIDRVDRQGLKKPPFFDNVREGDPVSESRSVANYLLLDENRFLTDPQIMEKYEGKILPYPKISGYYHLNRIVSETSNDWNDINIWLNNKLRNDGPKLQLNIVLVVTQYDQDYYYALMQAWRGARKNDVILFYGVDSKQRVKWSKAISFADGQNNQVMLSNLQTMTYDREFGPKLVKEQYQLITEQFKRVPNSDYQYLQDGWKPPAWLVTFVTVFNIVVTGIFTTTVINKEF